MASTTRPKRKLEMTPRKLGMTAEKLPYGHLLQTLPPKEKSIPRPEPAWDAPPIDLSDDSLTPERIPSPSPEPDLPAVKKATYVGFKVPLLRPRELDDDEEEETSIGHIKPTTFTSKGQGTQQSDLGYNQKRPKDELENEDIQIDPFGMLSSSQQSGSEHKRRHIYKSKNLHGSAWSPKRSTTTKKPTAPVVKTGTSGFRMPDTEATLAKLDKLAAQNEKPAFKSPLNFSALKSPGRGTRRSSRHQQTDDPPSVEFQIPPVVPPRLDTAQNATGSSFIVPMSASCSKHIPKAPIFKVPTCLQAAVDTFKPDDIIPLSKETLTRHSTSSSYPSLVTDGSSTSSLSSPPSSPILAASSLHLDPSSSIPDQEPTSLCPVCRDPVTASTLSTFTAEYTATKPSNRLTVRQQALFCRTHRTASAHQTWRTRGYPTLDWAGLPSRLSQHHAFILSIIQNSTPSYYRTQLDHKVGTGTNRTLRQAFLHGDEDGGAEMGYYGSKGAVIMMEYLIEQFYEELRKLAGEDKVVAAGGGVSGFVQRVLVPEVVLRFVMEDMGVGKEEAREVVREGAELGALLCEEEEEVVGGPESGDEDEEQGYGE